ncbi:hypothetical protein [Urbifossiella limnaea]|uniref:Uncharacterized protein n=1 Tax=Urbifossiella limnaea TaxID=2528023 RepID=A0A517Y130_9BACT|nr:hypothetical protein [Urbifossiella limnaea]QDU23454.1 hypothetical protein ETAA1_54540 [Urbifossiella limnaea]
MPAPPGAARRTGVGLGLLLAVGLFAAGVELARRSAGWFRPGAVAPFRVVVPTGDAVVRRGEPVTLSAYLDPTAADVPLPGVVELVTRAAPGEPETRRRMTPDAATGAAVVVLPAPAADFEYRVEAGPAASEWYAVRVADPVDLAPGTAVDLTPPAYAAATVKPRAQPGFADLDALAGSTAAVRLRFTRPAATAALEWKPDAPSALPETLPVALDADALGGSATFPVREPGVLRLVLANETGARKLRTEVPVRVRPRPDEPPRFASVAGFSNGRRAVLPGQRVEISLTVTDDVAVTGAELEVAAGKGFASVTRLPFPLTGAGTPTAEGRLTFDPTALAGVTGQGNGAGILRVRLRAADARPGGAPAALPDDGWHEWHVTPLAPPLDEQETFGPYHAVAERTGAAQKQLAEARGVLAPVLDARPTKGGLPVDHAARLADARAKVQAAAAALRAGAAEAERYPGTKAWAASYRDAAATVVAEADDFLRRAATDDPAVRLEALTAFALRQRQAVLLIGNLAAAHHRATRARLDADRLAALAVAYAALADRAATGADAAAERTRLAARFDAILADSEDLRAAVAASAGAERRDLARRAEALAAAARDLDAVADRLAADVRAAVCAELAAAQAALSERAVATLDRLGTAARLTRVTLPDPAGFRAAGEHLAGDRGAAALTELEKLAQALDRAAEGFARPAFDPADGKAVARALIPWQDDIRARAAGFPTITDAAKAALRTEQRALLAAAARLNLPADPVLAPLRDEVRVHLATAVTRLDADPKAAPQPMQLAAGALARLADATPSAAERRKRGVAELERLRAEHEAAAVGVEGVLRGFDRQTPDESVRREFATQVGPPLEQYEPLADRLAALDLPGFEARRAAAVEAVRTAAADLRAGLPLDGAAALAAARRALDRFAESVNGQQPVDALAAELARLQAELVVRPDPAAQAGITERLTRLSAPEAAVLLHDARETPKDARRAAEVLAALADRLAGRRTDADRLLTFTAARARAAAVAKAKAGQPASPTSDDERRQLGREAKELEHVRVGAAGQVLKRRALDAYARLAALAGPDRDAAGQAQLSELLGKLAAASAGVADVRRPDPPPEPDPAADYLPSPQLAARLNGLAAEQRGVRDRAKGVGDVVKERLRPADATAFDELERRLRESGAGPAADRLHVGDARTALLVLPADSALKAEVRALTTNAAAARQGARARELARDADALAAAVAATDQPAAVRSAAEFARQAARSLTTAAERTDAADVVGSDRARGEAVRALERVPRELRGTEPVGPDAGPGRAVRAAATAVRGGDLRRAAAALAEAARAAAP